MSRSDQSADESREEREVAIAVAIGCFLLGELNEAGGPFGRIAYVGEPLSAEPDAAEVDLLFSGDEWEKV